MSKLYKRLSAASGGVRRVAQKTSARDDLLFDDRGDFNPRPIGRVGDGGATNATPASEGRVYNQRGEINAYDKREAVEQAAHVVAGLLARPENDARFDRTASKDEIQRRNAMVRQAMGTDEGRRLVAQEMTHPLKTQVDYDGWTGKVLRVHSVEQGLYYRIPLDVRSTANVIGQDGQAIETQLNTKFVLPSKFPIAGMATLGLEDLSEVTYDMLDRARQTLEQEINRERDKRTVALLDATAPIANATTGFASVGLAVLEALRYQVERHGLFVDKFLLHRSEVSDVVSTMSATLDPASQRELNLQGVFARFYGANVITAAGIGVEQTVRAGRMYAVTAPEYLGEHVSWIDLMVTPIDKMIVGEPKKGFYAYELCGMAIPNHRSVALAIRS